MDVGFGVGVRAGFGVGFGVDFGIDFGFGFGAGLDALVLGGGPRPSPGSGSQPWVSKIAQTTGPKATGKAATKVAHNSGQALLRVPQE